MQNRNTADGKLPAAGFGRDQAQYLDSPELESEFLAAIGFHNADKHGTSKATAPSPPDTRPQPTSSVSRHGVWDQGAPAGPTRGSQAQAQTQVQTGASSTQWRRTANQPAPLTTTYWEAQRIAKGIVKPSAYPDWCDRSAPGPSAVQGGTKPGQPDASWSNPSLEDHGNTEGKSGKYWKMTAPKPFNEKPALPPPRVSQIASPGRWADPVGPSPTTRPSIKQSFVPDSPRRGKGMPERSRFKAGTKRGSSGTGTPSNKMKGRRQPFPRPEQMGQHSPDLAARRLPRPNRDYSGSSVPSLSSMISAMNISETGAGTQEANSTEDKPRPDIRNTIGLKPNIHKAGNTWMTYNWADPHGRDWNEDLWEPSYLNKFISAWMDGVPDQVSASFRQGFPDHWRCDIDTDTGHLLPPVEYPDTMVDHAQIDPELEWQRQNWTSALLIRRHNMNKRWPRAGHNGDRRRGPRSRVMDEPEAIGEDFIIAVHEHKLEMPEYNRYVPRIPCFLRPAQERDLEAVRLIYNWEVEHGFQALDSEPLSAQDFTTILRTAQRLGMPFIVAERGSARELGLTKGNTAYSAFRQVPFCEPERHGEILGFAFLSVWQPGLAGGGIGSSRATATVHVYVHRDYRRNKIGFSMLDMLLTTVSDRFSSQSGYDFVDPGDSPVYKNVPDRERQYHKLYVTYRVRNRQQSGEDTNRNNNNNDDDDDDDDDDNNDGKQAKKMDADDELAWVRRLLVDQLNFSELMRLEAVHRSAPGREGRPAVWLDEVVFEHTCHFGPDLIRNDY